MATAKERVLSGMRPSGKLHLGNLVGALRNWRDLQDRYKCFYFIADWHALTTEYANTEEIKENALDMAIDWLAAGLDPEQSTLFVQSWVPQHAELHLLLSMITPLPWLERCPSYKEQQAELREKDLSTYGFLGYPLLQAADIIIYKAHYVPVGVDQVAHVELTREIARRFNFLYREVFPEPEALLTEVPKLMGIDGRKMSKSYDNAIYLSDPPEVIRKKAMQTLTDPARARREDPGNPEVCTLFSYHRLFSRPEQIEEVDRACRTAAFGCTDCKKILAANLVAEMQPHYERRQKLAEQPGEVLEVLREGSRRAAVEAGKTLEDAKEAMRVDL